MNSMNILGTTLLILVVIFLSAAFGMGIERLLESELQGYVTAALTCSIIARRVEYDEDGRVD